MSVRTPSAARPVFPVAEFVRASSLHVGAAASAAALRRDLVDSGRLSSETFDEAYAVARITPGTNLLAMYVLLGERFGGWIGALTALGLGALVPAVIAVLLGAIYVAFSGHPIADRAMQGARAAALAVFIWAIVRLVRPQLQRHRGRGLAIASVTLLMTVALPIPPFAILLIAGGLGATLLKGDS